MPSYEYRLYTWDYGALVYLSFPHEVGEGQMSRRLPQLSALRAFEAAARHVSFTRAAEELSVTQGAVKSSGQGAGVGTRHQVFQPRTAATEHH